VRDADYGPGPWPDEPSGMIKGPPTIVTTTSGSERSYWVEFDQPQHDVDGGGPYVASQVLERYIESVDG